MPRSSDACHALSQGAAMEPETLKGFIGAARELGYQVADEQAFLREQQTRVFEWAAASEISN
jgi:hypothetical protein